jgi:hypothetical protein
MKEMTITEYMKNKYDNREDKDNIFGVGITDDEFRKFAIDYLLGEDWYVTDSVGQTQVNEIALDAILSKYSKRFKKEIKLLKRSTKRSKLLKAIQKRNKTIEEYY